MKKQDSFYESSVSLPIMKIGDTVCIGNPQLIPPQNLGSVLGSVERKIIPKGSKAFVVSIDKPNRFGLQPMRLLFGFKRLKDDLWCLDDWRPSMCRMVLTEKTIVPFTLDNIELMEYINSDM